MLTQPLYINSIASIHPECKKRPDWQTADWQPGKQLVAIEPDYKELIENASIRRRMSRMVKMGVAAGLECIRKTPYQPDAILTATGLGCLADTEKFMNNLLDMNEELLPPTAFIQSTFNTIGAQIALLTGNHCYNNTYVHRGLSFESALLDVSLLISEREAAHVLVGAVDELTPTLYKILERLGCWKDSPAGEGASFFLLSDEPTESSCAVLQDIDMFSGSYTQDEIENRMEEFFARNNASNIYVIEPKAYKQYCGEYPTAAAFGTWYACRYPQLSYTLVRNSFLNNHSFILIKHMS